MGIKKHFFTRHGVFIAAFLRRTLLRQIFIQLSTALPAG